MDTLFFLIQICGMMIIVYWAYRNDRRATIALQDGVLAMSVPEAPDDRTATERAGPGDDTGKLDDRVKPGPRTAPPRRRFSV